MSFRAGYVKAKGDEVTVKVSGVPEISKTYTPLLLPAFSPGLEPLATHPNPKEIATSYDAVIPPP